MVEIPINIIDRHSAGKEDICPKNCSKEAELKEEKLENGGDVKPPASAVEPESPVAAAPADKENKNPEATAAVSGEQPAAGNPAPESEPESEIEELKKEISKLQKENREMQEQVLRVRAEADNFRKRMQKEKDDFARFAREGFIRDLLPVKDNLERALAHAEEDPGSIVDGVRLTLEQFDAILKNMGVEPIESLGKPFDPSLHEAMAQVESDECKPNTVVNELQKGYTLHGRLLRPAMVAVAKAKNQEN